MRLKKLSTKKERITIDRVVDSVEVDFDFTQLYDCFSLLSYRLKKAISFKILFYILKKLPKDNIIDINRRFIEGFMEEYKRQAGEDITARYFYNCLKDLDSAHIIKKLGPGRYFVNPYVFWKDDKGKRVEYIQSDAGGIKTFAFNPINLLLDEPGVEYKLEQMTDDITDAEIEEMNSEQ